MKAPARTPQGGQEQTAHTSGRTTREPLAEYLARHPRAADPNEGPGDRATRLGEFVTLLRLVGGDRVMDDAERVSVRRVDLSSVLVYSLRYALPRESYAPAEVIACVRKYLADLLLGGLETMVRDIVKDRRQALEYKLAKEQAPEWVALQGDVEGEIARRKG